MGIRFASAARFEPPVPEPDWTQTKNATLFIPACPSDGGDPKTASEDCLGINVWTPSLSSSKPVMFWIYGGGFAMGSNSDLRLTGQSLARNGDVVVVAPNYRLEAFGWFKGNNGLLDQRLALLWTQRNIGAFGGDPSRVTIFGQSAGAISVNVHMTSPPSWPLFQKALAESPVPGLRFRTPSEAWVDELEFMARAKCSTMECLKNASMQTIMEASGGQVGLLFPPFRRNILRWSPIIDGINVLDSPVPLYQAGKFRPNTPLLIGHTSNETVGFTGGFQTKFTPLEVEAVLVAYFGLSQAHSILQAYGPPSNDTQAWEVASRVSTDLVFSCPVQQIASAVPHAQAYVFMHAPSHDIFNPSFCWNKFTCHACELSFVFRERAVFSPAESQLSHYMQSVWSAFAHNGTVPWPAYGSNKTMMAIDLPQPYLIHNYISEQCKALYY